MAGMSDASPAEKQRSEAPPRAHDEATAATDVIAESAVEALEAEGSDNATTIESDLANREKTTVTGARFGTFTGVVRPTVLTILGVMMYLREGWVVGHAGLGGAVLLILTAYFITGTTALSLSSITTNIRLGAGGVFSIATQALGLEVGGSIGIPFYLAQTLSVAMYLYGFVEGWGYLFPQHDSTLVAIAVFAAVFALSYLSTSLAFRAQLLVMAGVFIALGSMAWTLRAGDLQAPHLVGDFEGVTFWTLFAVFFPASTGIMVGASMSGNLADPRRSIPRGTMAAWGISLAVYLLLAVWYSLVATPAELKTNLTVAVDKASWGPGILIGVLSSCFVAALSSLVASPRTLNALGKHSIVPFARFFSRETRGEPRNAVAFTGALVFVAILFGDLNSIARVVTVFFLMTYFTVNLILVIEKQLNLISFRPLFRVPIAVPVLGSLATLAAIVVVAPVIGLACVLISLAIYVLLDRRSLDDPYETLNSGLFMSIADWAATRVAMGSSGRTLRGWKPDFLVPIERATQLEGIFHILLALSRPKGSIQVLGVRPTPENTGLDALPQLIGELKEERIFAPSTIVDSPDFLGSLRTSASVLESSFFRPNILFATAEDRSQEDLEAMIAIAEKHEMGFALLARHPDAGFALRRRLNVWISDQSPNWHLSFDLANRDLQLLLALMLMRNWKMKLRVITLVREDAHVERASQYLHDLMVLARMPPGFEIIVEQAPFARYVRRAPRADLNVFGLAREVDREFIGQAVEFTQSTCLFVRDSGQESALV